VASDILGRAHGAIPLSVLNKASAALALRGFAPIAGTSVKERLTGAIILVALIVLLVPELLTGPIRSAPRAVASAAGGPPLRSITINVGDAAHSTPAEPQAAATESPAPVPLPGPEPGGQDAAMQPQADAAVPAAAAPAAAASAPAATPPQPRSKAEATPLHTKADAPASAAGSGALVVQLGSFASRSNAERFAQKLKGQGFTASVSQYPSGRRLYRVWVGPVRDHGAAVQLQSKLQAAGHVGAIVAK
jgi:DedD protein